MVCDRDDLSRSWDRNRRMHVGREAWDVGVQD